MRARPGVSREMSYQHRDDTRRTDDDAPDHDPQDAVQASDDPQIVHRVVSDLIAHGKTLRAEH
jgi:pyrimidine operon attenuation protein/uracil phosphoribosyltransferase